LVILLVEEENEDGIAKTSGENHYFPMEETATQEIKRHEKTTYFQVRLINNYYLL